jgi:hypothetical protein
MGRDEACPYKLEGPDNSEKCVQLALRFLALRMEGLHVC